MVIILEGNCPGGSRPICYLPYGVVVMAGNYHRGGYPGVVLQGVCVQIRFTYIERIIYCESGRL